MVRMRYRDKERDGLIHVERRDDLAQRARKHIQTRFDISEGDMPSQASAVAWLQAFIYSIREALREGDEGSIVLLRGLGQFERKYRTTKRFHNVATGKYDASPPRAIVRFRCGRKLAMEINGEDVSHIDEDSVE